MTNQAFMNHQITLKANCQLTEQMNRPIHILQRREGKGVTVVNKMKESGTDKTRGSTMTLESILQL